MTRKTPDRRWCSGESTKDDAVPLPWLVFSNAKITTAPSRLDESSTSQVFGIYADYDTKLLHAEPQSPPREMISLPGEFATRELLELDAENPDESLRFAREYGVVACPYFGSFERYSKSASNAQVSERLVSSFKENPASFVRARREGFRLEAWRFLGKEPNGFRDAFCDIVAMSDALRLSATADGTPGTPLLAFEEHLSALATLRECVALLMALDDKEGSLPDAVDVMMRMGIVPHRIVRKHDEPWRHVRPQEYMLMEPSERKHIKENIVLMLKSQRSVENAYIFLNEMAFGTGKVAFSGARAFLGEYEFEFGAFPEEPSGTTHATRRESATFLDLLAKWSDDARSVGSAIALQLFSTLSSDATWKTCKCKECSRRYKSHRRKDGTCSQKRSRESSYCSRQCQDERKKIKDEAENELQRRIEQCCALPGMTPEKLEERIRLFADDINHTPRFIAPADARRQAGCPRMCGRSGKEVELRHPVIPAARVKEIAASAARLAESPQD